MNPPEDSQPIFQAGKSSVNINNSATNENSRSVGKRKYTKRAKPKNESESNASDHGNKNDRKQGRWSREEKQKFIDGKFQFLKSDILSHCRVVNLNYFWSIKLYGIAIHFLIFLRLILNNSKLLESLIFDINSIFTAYKNVGRARHKTDSSC
jgi:hypothetical protein